MKSDSDLPVEPCRSSLHRAYARKDNRRLVVVAQDRDIFDLPPREKPSVVVSRMRRGKGWRILLTKRSDGGLYLQSFRAMRKKDGTLCVLVHLVMFREEAARALAVGIPLVMGMPPLPPGGYGFQLPSADDLREVAGLPPCKEKP